VRRLQYSIRRAPLRRYARSRPALRRLAHLERSRRSGGSQAREQRRRVFDRCGWDDGRLYVLFSSSFQLHSGFPYAGYQLIRLVLNYFAPLAPVNTWTHGKKIPAEVQRTFGKRLDYIWYRPPALPPRWSSLVNSLAYTSTSSPPYPSSSASNNPDPNQHQHRHLHLPTLTCTETEVVLTEVVPNEEYSYSDHFGLRAKFSIEHAFPSSSDPSLVADHPHASSSSPLEDTSAPMTAYGSGESGTSSTPLHQPRFTESQLRNKTLETLQTVEALIRHHRKAHLPHANHLFALVPVYVASPFCSLPHCPTSLELISFPPPSPSAPRTTCYFPAFLLVSPPFSSCPIVRFSSSSP
jgi:hypothetical protein